MSKKLSFNEVSSFVNNTGAKLISTVYSGNYSKLDVICPKGHLYHPTFNAIKRGRGCSVCYKSTEARRAVKAKPEKILEAIAVAEKHGGKCLSEDYINNRSKLKFQCEKGHEWETSFKSINRNSWCPECSAHSITDNKRKEKIVLAKEFASNYEGKLVNYNIDSFKEKFTWQCSSGHTWKATFQNVVYNNSWCPYCKSSYSENICRTYLEYLLECKFDRVRPKWLLSDKNRLMELDGFNENLNLAFEHQGLQHYEKIDYLNSEESQKRDIIKKDLCNKNGVKVLYIPALFYLTDVNDLHNYIGTELIKLDIVFDKSKLVPVSEVMDLRAVKLIEYKKELEKIKEIAKNKGGECLSDIYSGFNCKMKFKCSCGYIWTTKAFSIKKGCWCLRCSNRTNKTIDDIKEVANKINIECLEKDYINNSTHMSVKCKICGHEWKSTYNNLQYLKGCPVCVIKSRSKKRKKGIEVYQEAAKKKNGKCLSTEINSCYDKLEWECEKEHRWFGRADMIKNTKHWCPTCYKEKTK